MRSVIHADHHALWIDPKDSKHLILGNDGGLYFSKDKGVEWEAIRNLPIGQFYGVAVDMRKPFHVYGGLQDNGSWGGPSATQFADGIALNDWKRIPPGGDGFQAAADPNDLDTVFMHESFRARRPVRELISRPAVAAWARAAAARASNRRRRKASRLIALIGMRLSCCRRTNRRRFTMAAIFCSNRRIAATSGTRSAPT